MHLRMGSSSCLLMLVARAFIWLSPLLDCTGVLFTPECLAPGLNKSVTFMSERVMCTVAILILFTDLETEVWRVTSLAQGHNGCTDPSGSLPTFPSQFHPIMSPLYFHHSM
jgi:hypothetical protein